LNQVINQPIWLVVTGGVVLGAAVYGVMVLIFGVKEARGILSAASQFVRRKFQQSV